MFQKISLVTSQYFFNKIDVPKNFAKRFLISAESDFGILGQVWKVRSQIDFLFCVFLENLNFQYGMFTLKVN